MRQQILIVDDSKTVRIIIRRALRAYDCDLLEAANGAEGLELAARLRPDLILLDVTMPVMDGVEMLRYLKEDQTLSEIPVVILTADVAPALLLKIARIGIRDFLVKPLKESLLVEKVQRIVDLRLPPAAAAARPSGSSGTPPLW